MFASIFSPLQRLLAHPKLPWIMLWLGLAFLIVALVVMIRTSWGQSRPLRKCAALSLLAHLLLLCYATTIEIVMTVGGAARQTNVSVTLIDGTEENIDDPAAEPDGEIGSRAATSTAPEPNSEPLDRAEADQIAVDRPPDVVEMPATEATPPSMPVAHPPLPPLLEVAKSEPQSKPAEAMNEPQPGEAARPVAQPSIAQHPITPDLPPVASVMARSSSAIERPAESLPPVDVQSPLPKLPEPPNTSDVAEWSSGQPSSGSQTQGPAMANPTVATVPNGGAAAGNAPTGPLSETVAAPIASQPVPEIYADRVAADRTEIARRYGGSPEAVKSVDAALYWLAANQSDDGRWDPGQFGAGQERQVLGQHREGAGAKADTGITGLALLAFLGAGNTHQQGEYSKTVQGGLEFLLRVQGPDGNLGGSAEKFAFMYSHGMATFALSEAYAMTGDKRLETAVRKAIDYTISAQLPSTGGWRYQATDKHNTPVELGDTSQLGWQLMAIKSAELAGIEIPTRVNDGVVRFLKIVSTGKHGGKASYQPGPPKPTTAMTAEALVCRQFLGMARDNPASNEAGDYLLQDLPSPQRINLYYWYYGTLAMFQLQGQHWERWNQAMQTTLVSRQRGDGKWAGSWDPDCQWGGYGGRVYSTAVSALCLEVYYRYLPLYRIAETRRDRPQ